MKKNTAHILIAFTAIFHLSLGLVSLYLCLKLPQFSKKDIFNAVWVLLTGFLFFVSNRLLGKKRKMADFFFASALISAALINGEMFEIASTKHIQMFLWESIIMGLVLFLLFLWWSNYRLKKTPKTGIDGVQALVHPI